MDALLAAPDRRTRQGARDHALLLFLYNAGARADEAARLTVADLDLGSSPAVQAPRQGEQDAPLSVVDVDGSVLKTLVADRGGQEPVFLNRRREAITRFGIYDLVRRYAARAAQRVPSIATKRVSPHVIRHTTAVHLLRAGVDINTIRAWLGHVSLDTTNIYAEVDLEMKAKALGECSIPARRAGPGVRNRGSWPSCGHSEAGPGSTGRAQAGEIMWRPWTLRLACRRPSGGGAT